LKCFSIFSFIILGDTKESCMSILQLPLRNFTYCNLGMLDIFCYAQRAFQRPRLFAVRCKRLVYARHGRELMGLKSPVGVPCNVVNRIINY
jgi:hypothetical protein